MTEKKWTPGPWVLKQESGYQQIIANGESIMGDETYYPWVPENNQDWNLIAAASELYDAMEALEFASDALCAARTQSIYDAMIDAGQSDLLLDMDVARRAARAALAKARGEK